MTNLAVATSLHRYIATSLRRYNLQNVDTYYYYYGVLFTVYWGPGRFPRQSEGIPLFEEVIGRAEQRLKNFREIRGTMEQRQLEQAYENGKS